MNNTLSKFASSTATVQYNSIAEFKIINNEQRSQILFKNGDKSKND